jgi:hypothetical protein
MIKISKTVRKEKGLCLIVTELDAKAADINTECEKDVIDYRLEEHLIKLSDHVDNDTVIKCLKEFLIESVFTHYIDMVGILNYIYTIRNVIKVMKNHPSHSKFLFVTKFRNYEGEESDDNSQPNTDEDENPAIYDVSFKTDLLKRDNLGGMEEILLSMFYTLYEGKILVLEPRRLEISLKKKDTEEFVNMNVSFCKPK